MSYRYVGEHGPDYLVPSLNEPRWLFFVRPREISAWRGVNWHSRNEHYEGARSGKRWRAALRGHTGPKLLLASSLDRGDLEDAQQLFQVCRGPTILSTLPVPETGCRLLASAWADHAVEQILLFLRRNS